MIEELAQGDAEPGAGELGPFQAVNRFFEQAADHVHLGDDMRAVLRSSYRELRVQIPLRMDDGSGQVFIGYRVQHNGARGPKGGLRYHPAADLDEVRGPGCADDLEDRRGRRPVRRSKRRHRL